MSTLVTLGMTLGLSVVAALAALVYAAATFMFLATTLNLVHAPQA
jgi:hypothetical protein